MHIVDVVLGGVVDRDDPAGCVGGAVGEVLDLEVIGRAGPGLGDQHR